MIHNIQSLINFSISATDGEIGKVKDFYFDDQTWKVRYLVVETGNWLVGRKVLISPVALYTPDWDSESFPANLTVDQVKNSPDVDTNRPVSRQQEAELHSHYLWAGTGSGGTDFMTTGMVGAVVDPSIPLEEKIHEQSSDADPHLRSYKALLEYEVYSNEVLSGKVAGFIVDDSSWTITRMEVSIDNVNEEKHEVPTSHITNIDYERSAVFITSINV